MMINLSLLFFLCSLTFIQKIEGAIQSESVISPNSGVELLNYEDQVLVAERMLDRELRRVLWFYLRGATCVFTSHKKLSSELRFFAIYTNAIGTFAAVNSWDRLKKMPEIQAIIRLGPSSMDPTISNSLYSIDPSLLSLHMGENQYEIELSGGRFIIHSDISTGYPEGLSQSQLNQKVQIMGIHLIRIFWFWLYDAKLTETSVITTNEYVHVLFTYSSNRFVSFALVHLKNLRNQMKISTFIKLGNTVSNSQPFPTISLDPQIIVLQ